MMTQEYGHVDEEPMKDKEKEKEEEEEAIHEEEAVFHVADLFAINPTFAYFYTSHLLSESEPADSFPDPLSKFPRMKKRVHGRLGEGRKWRPPHLVTNTKLEARPGYAKISAKEYLDDRETLVEKVKVFAEMLRRSCRTVAYTGAGISTSAGISDYASKEKSLVTRPPRKKAGLAPTPSLAHFVMTAMGKESLLHHWVQQNHDGLPQKAGFPQHDLNEIHGSLYDCSNPIVQMDGHVRTDLHKWLNHEVEMADLVVVVGSSLCGMNADRLVDKTCQSFNKKRMEDENQKKGSLGSVIIGYQKTPYDKKCSLRFYAKIDEVFLLLAHELRLSSVNFHPTPPPIPPSALPSPHVYSVPYDPVTGEKTPDGSCHLWDLNTNKKVKLVGVDGEEEVVGVVSNIADLNEPVGKSHYGILLPSVFEKGGEEVRGLGGWWVSDACLGIADRLPCVNVE